jgi:dynactin 1
LASRAALGHQRTMSNGLSRTNTTRSLGSSRSGSPSKASSANVSPNPGSPAAPRTKQSPVKRVPSMSVQARTSTRRQSTHSEAPGSPVVSKQRSTEAFVQDHAPSTPLLSQSPPAASLLSASPLQPSSLRRVSTPPPPQSPQSLEEFDVAPTRPSTPPVSPNCSLYAKCRRRFEAPSR